MVIKLLINSYQPGAGALLAQLHFEYSSFLTLHFSFIIGTPKGVPLHALKTLILSFIPI